MKHTSSRDVFTHWNESRGRNPAPQRADIDPGAIRHSLGDVFMLSVDFGGEFRFRLAGTRICALFRRELKNEIVDGLWSEASREQVRLVMVSVLRAMLDRTAPALIATAE